MDCYQSNPINTVIGYRYGTKAYFSDYLEPACENYNSWNQFYNCEGQCCTSEDMEWESTFNPEEAPVCCKDVTIPPTLQQKSEPDTENILENLNQYREYRRKKKMNKFARQTGAVRFQTSADGDSGDTGQPFTDITNGKTTKDNSRGSNNQNQLNESFKEEKKLQKMFIQRKWLFYREFPFHDADPCEFQEWGFNSSLLPRRVPDPRKVLKKCNNKISALYADVESVLSEILRKNDSFSEDTLTKIQNALARATRYLGDHENSVEILSSVLNMDTY